MRQITAEIRVLSDDELELIHISSLKLLGKTGIRVPNAAVCALAKALGAQVDPKDFRVRIPPSVIEELIRLARAGGHRFQSSSGAVSRITGSVSTEVFVVDYLTGARREGTLEDVRDGIALIQSLDNIPLANAVTVPADAPGGLTDVASFCEIYKYSKKDGGTYILSPHSAKYILEMAQVCGREVSYLVDTVSPLGFAEQTLEIALLFGRAGMPLTMTPLVMAGSTGPVSLAGTLTLQNAEALGLLFIIYAITGKLTSYVASGHSSDVMRSMLCSFGSPNQALLGIGAAQLARYYGLSAGSNSGLTDALAPDFQCGFEKGFSAVMSVLAGCNAIGGQGIVGADQGFSFEQLALDNEWLDALNYTTRGIEVSEESIGIETIEEVGVGGNFLGEAHTVEYMRQSWWPETLFERSAYVSGQSRDLLLQKTHDWTCEQISKNRTDEPVIPQEAASELDAIAARAVEDL